MRNQTQMWQSRWEEAIKCSSLAHMKNDLTDRDRINQSSNITYKNYYKKINLTELEKKREFQAELNRLKRFITKKSSLLDIGAGFGRLAIPLARGARKVTVIEPSQISMKVMQEKAEEEGIDNMEFAEMLWSDFPLKEKYDLVYSTWGPGANDPISLMKMHEASCSYCALEYVATPPQMYDLYGQIYPMIRGEDYRPPGNYLNIITTLYEHGIYANLETWDFYQEIKYHSIDDALIIWKLWLENYVEISREVDEKLRRFYQHKMNRDGSYSFNLRGNACMIWWKV